jgi:hypothetical protein
MALRLSLAAAAVLAALARPALAADISAAEEQLLARAQAVAAAPLDDFALLGERPAAGGRGDPGYRYQIAFLGYGVASLASAAPARTEECRAILVRLVEKMEHEKTRAYWRARGYAGDGLSRGNAMYRGHLNLLYGLARERFGEARFDERFHALSRALFEEMGPAPVCCEPDDVFIQCNAVSALSLHLHDRCFGTSYGAAAKGLLAWARGRMAIEGTTLFRDDYRPSSGASSLRRTGYANAWAISFLSPIPELEGETRAMWRDWRRSFAVEGVLFAAGRGAPRELAVGPAEAVESALLSTTFGTIAARDMGEPALARKLARVVGAAGEAAALAADWIPEERRGALGTFRTLALFARAFRGWRAVLGGAPPRADAAEVR